MTIRFGAQIEVNGQQPTWLADDVTVKFVNSASYSHTRTVGAIAFGTLGGVHVTHIRLPADHFAYKAIAAGFEPFNGNSAPDDWDGGEVLLSSTTAGRGNVREYHPSSGFVWNNEDRPDVKVIGYRKKATPQPLADVTPLWNAIDTAKQALDALQRAVADHVTQQPTDQALTIRITGPQGSGKTRWAEMLRDLIPAMTKIGFPVPIVVDAGEEG